jgi:N-acetylmuramoyl-L-alanine amidase
LFAVLISNNRITAGIASALFLVLLLSFSCHAAASGRIEVKGVRCWSSADYTRIVIDLSSTSGFTKNRLANPDRLFFDLQNASLKKDIEKNLPVGDGILKNVRAGQFNADTVRVVLDLENISDYNALVLDDPARLVIDVYGAGKEIKKPETVFPKRKIIIDPGHGGHDPGAVGYKGLFEKDVVLDIGLKLRKILQADPLNEVIMTRETDVFIPLDERTVIANRQNADLFVSIHANASPRRTARGVETYLLNWTNDEEAMRVAARENAISLKKMKEMNRQRDVLEIIKSDLIRENKRDESIKLAHQVQNSMISSLRENAKNSEILNLGVKQAFFYVLFGARMPSVLAEVSFISNPEEERLLSQESYRAHISRAIAGGVNKYFSSAPSIPAVQRVARSKSL